MRIFGVLILLTMLNYGMTTDHSAGLQLVQAISLKHVNGRIDHMAVDGQRKRLYIAALGNNTVEVIDLEKGKQAGRIEGVEKPQGVCVLPESGNVVVASGGDGKCRLYDPSLKLLGTIEGLEDADNVRYDPDGKKIYVGYGDGSLAVIDAEKFAKVGQIKLDGHPESFQLESGGKRIFVNVPDAREIEVIDREKGSVIAKWAVKEAKANFPMALDRANQRLFVGCRRPAKLLVLETDSGKTVATLECCGDADDVSYDAKSQRIIISGGEGCISLYDQADADHYSIANRVKTGSGARTSLFDAGRNQLYLAVPARGGQSAEIRVFGFPQAK